MSPFPPTHPPIRTVLLATGALTLLTVTVTCPGQRYILARGPAPEYAFVYVIVPADRLAEVQRIEPLASVNIVARVVNGRSTYLANPILELVELP